MFRRKAQRATLPEILKGMRMCTLDEKIIAARQAVRQLLRTEVTAFDVATVTEAICPGWSEDDIAMVLELAVAFAETTGHAVLQAMDSTYVRNMAEMEHYFFVGYELGGHLDLPVDFDWSDEDRERSILHRHVLYPLPPNS